MKLLDVYKVKARKGHVGIEIEVEGEEPMPDINSEWWTSKDENSLRNYGKEYISARPFEIDEKLGDKISGVCKAINSKKVVKDCTRTSIHVHHNMTKATVLEVLTCATAYWLLENLLMRHCGPAREGNLFCLRLKDAEAIIPMLTQNLESEKPMMYIDDRFRYAGLNLKALGQFGSLEVRGMRGTTDPDLIEEWSRETHKMFEVAKEFGAPDKLFDFFIKVDKRTFVQYFFGAAFADKLLSIPRWQDMMDDSAVLVCNFAYAFEWDHLVKKIEKAYAKSKNKEGSAYAQAVSEIMAANVAAGNWTTSASIPAGTVLNPVIYDDVYNSTPSTWQD